ncbi:hypothetical protein OHS33_38980 (plasmid) [Streptomyces sp. NBC_00536]|uniref:hypothetical protein n=1 Tax=Streptomyces sp. NBC_00536 TaxID=2975769 RepID=UPI002E7FE81B|nr:hypothetical protein [Streptomyces sp. NBC_00536]WUC84343.1 hypothetical protein OHS33_38980 [Streptomyces sp. NBC_00536]
MAVANRSARLRKLASKLTSQFGLPWGPEAIDPRYDDVRREWSFEWPDGPTVAQVRRAANAADPEATEGLLYRRTLSAETYALGVLRITVASDPANKDFESPWILPSHVEKLFEKTKSPKARGREAAIVANIVAMSEASGGPGWGGESQVICDHVKKKGIAGFLTGVELTQVEALTQRYASGDAERAWRRRMAPLTPLEAFSAVQADEQPPAAAVEAALALLPELHAALDAAADRLRARATHHEVPTAP